MRQVFLPFEMAQAVSHDDWPGLDFVVLSQELDSAGSWTISVTDRKGGGFWRFPAEQLK